MLDGESTTPETANRQAALLKLSSGAFLIDKPATSDEPNLDVLDLEQLAPVKRSALPSLAESMAHI